MSNILRRVTHSSSNQQTKANPFPETVYDCPICHDGGFVHPLKENGKPDYSRSIPCRCREVAIKERRNKKLIEVCGLPFGTEDWTLENYRTDQRWPTLEEAKQAAISFTSNAEKPQWLILMGHQDVGKSHLAIGICRKWIAMGRPAKYILVPQMLDDLREGYAQDRRRETPYERDREVGLSSDWGELPYEAQMRLLKDIDLLVLDDLGSQVPTPWAMEKIMLLIDYRYINGLSLVVTTNKGLDELPGDKECRIGSRLLRFSESTIVTIEADDFRTWGKEGKDV